MLSTFPRFVLLSCGEEKSMEVWGRGEEKIREGSKVVLRRLFAVARRSHEAPRGQARVTQSDDVQDRLTRELQDSFVHVWAIRMMALTKEYPR